MREPSVEKNRAGKQTAIKTRRQKHPFLNVKDKGVSADCSRLLGIVLVSKIGKRVRLKSNPDHFTEVCQNLRIHAVLPNTLNVPEVHSGVKRSNVQQEA